LEIQFQPTIGEVGELIITREARLQKLSMVKTSVIDRIVLSAVAIFISRALWSWLIQGQTPAGVCQALRGFNLLIASISVAVKFNMVEFNHPSSQVKTAGRLLMLVAGVTLALDVVFWILNHLFLFLFICFGSFGTIFLASRILGSLKPEVKSTQGTASEQSIERESLLVF
jgi:hypothetical protein